MTIISAGDKLHVRLANGTQIYSNSYKQISFSGFLLYPDDKLIFFKEYIT